jgi:hypothetical protein
MSKSYSAYGRNLTKGKRGKYLYDASEEENITSDVQHEKDHMIGEPIRSNSHTVFDIAKTTIRPEQILLFQGNMEQFKAKYPFNDHSKYIQFNGYVMPNVC